MSRVRVALVGLGDIGLGAHLPALLRHDAVEVALLVDEVPDRIARALKLSPTVATGPDLDAVLAASNLDGVVLATPPWATPELAIRCLRAGLFVLAEKPVATSLAAAAAYEVLTDAERARLQVGLTYRHDPAIQTLAGWLRDGRLGSPVLVRAHIYDEVTRPGDAEHLARITATLAHGMPVVHEGAHVFDWLSHLLGGQPERIDDAWSLRTAGDLPNPNVTGARLTYPGGSTAVVEFGWLTAAQPRCELSVLGADGLAVLDGTTFALRLETADGVEVVEHPGERLPRSFDLQVDRFAALIEGRRTHGVPSLADGIAALTTAERVATMASGRKV
jgi:predicted dehydrogenase